MGNLHFPPCQVKGGGEAGILDILNAFHDCWYEDYIRPDHGQHLWGEGSGNVRPGHGLYDRALGTQHMLGGGICWTNRPLRNDNADFALFRQSGSKSGANRVKQY